MRDWLALDPEFFLSTTHYPLLLWRDVFFYPLAIVILARRRARNLYDDAQVPVLASPTKGPM